MNDKTTVAAQRPDHAAALSIIIGIMLAMFLSALEQTIVAPALPTIGRALNDVENLSWVVTAYLLSTTVATPLFGKLSDIYGRRTMMLIALGIFTVGSVCCALAPSMATLILARTLQGIGGGGLLPLGQTVIADLLTPRERPVVQSYSSAMFLAACILGPVLGGVLTDYVHWTLIFWINLPLGLVAIAMTDRALRRLPRHERPHKLDVVGAALMVAATVALLLALSWGRVRYAWNSPQIVGLVGGSVVLWAMFVWRLVRAPEPFIPLTMMKDRVVFGIVVAGFFSIGTIIGLSIFIPVYVELVLGRSPSASGVVMIMFMCGATLGSMIAGRLISRLDRYKRVPAFGIPIGIGALVVLAIWPGQTSLLELSVLLAVGGAGLGPMYPATTLIMQNAVPLHQLGIATGTLAFFRQLGGAIIVAVFSAIVLGGLEGLDKSAPPEHVAELFRWVFVAGAVFLTIALLALVGIEEQPMRGPARHAEPPAREPAAVEH